MARLTQSGIRLPPSVQVECYRASALTGAPLVVKATGTYGSLFRVFPPNFFVRRDKAKVFPFMHPLPESRKEKAKLGLYNALLHNMLRDVKLSFKCAMELKGIGFKVLKEDYDKDTTIVEGGKKERAIVKTPKISPQLPRLLGTPPEKGSLLEQNNSKLVLYLGFSHQVVVPLPPEIRMNITNKKGTRFLLQGIDRQKVMEFAAYLEKLRYPNVYTGKGIHFVGKTYRQKAGKKKQ